MAKGRRAPTPLLIVFLDLTRFAAQSQRVADTEIAETLDAFYRMAASAIESAGGRTVKFIGDAALAIFPELGADAAIGMLLELKPAVDRFMEERGWECRFTARAHFGEVIAGEFGPDGSRRFDVVGRAVNAAAMLPSAGITLSVEAFRQLTPDMRRYFRKHTPPTTYVRPEHSRPFNRADRIVQDD